MKNYLSLEVAATLGEMISNEYSSFDQQAFIDEITPDYEELSIKERAFRIAAGFNHCLPKDYPEAIQILINALPPSFADEEDIALNGLRFWPFACFIEAYGLDDLETSFHGMYAVTQRFSAEFAIRPFLLRYPSKVFDRLNVWASDESLHVRRLVSEGTRPRLPWGARLPVYLDGEANIIPLLSKLKNDAELYVRRSVANHFNDLTKDHPEVVLDLFESWSKDDERTNWVIKHSLRSLIKAGNQRALSLLGFKPVNVEVQAFSAKPGTLSIGENLELSLSIENRGSETASLAVDFVVHYMKANGKTSAKVFKWATPKLAPGEALSLSKKVLLVQRSTRKLYPGKHKVEVQINGNRFIPLRKKKVNYKKINITHK